MSSGPYGEPTPPPGYGGGPADGYGTGYGGYPAAQPPVTGYPPTMGGYPPGGGYPPYPAPRNGLGTAALVLGIIGVVLCWIPFTGWALNILAVIFGAIGRARAHRGEATNGSSAVAGLVLGIIGLAVWIVIIIVISSAVHSVVTTTGTLSS